LRRLSAHGGFFMIDMRTKAKSWIKQCEGFRAMPYYDTEGHLTIGFGRNLSSHGVSLDEAEHMIDNDIDDCILKLSRNCSWYNNAPENVKIAVLNMCFNLGFTKFLTFHELIDALIERNYTKASQEVLNSKWALEIKERAKDVAVMIREQDAKTGTDNTN
jgi:lysozyme